MEYNDGGMLRRYLYGTGIDKPVCMETVTSVYYFHFDALGSVVALSDQSGNSVETYAYSPFGKGAHESAVGNPYMYTARRYDPETELYYYRARYYDSEIGRFLQVDPIGFAGGMNLYEYCLNNPANLVDPSGLLQRNEDGTFGDSEYWVNNDQVSTILAGDGYTRKTTPQVGDTLIYRDSSGGVVHSVTVSEIDSSGSVTKVRGLGGIATEVSETTPEAGWPGAATMEYYGKGSSGADGGRK